MKDNSALETSSIRTQLLLTISIALMVIWGVVAWLAYDKGLHEAEELMDGQLALSARLLDGQIKHEEISHPNVWYPVQSGSSEMTNPALIENLDPEGRLPYEQELAFQIWTVNGVLKLYSENALGMIRSSVQGYGHQEFNDLLWRTYTKTTLDGNYVIQVAHPLNTRDRIGLDVAWRVIIPLLIALPLLILAMGWAINRSLMPLNRVANDLVRRKKVELEPIPLQGVPREILPIIQAFNVLLARVSSSIQHERRFTSNAAHELRTPLAGIKLYAQLAESTTEPAEREKFLSQVLNGIARADRLVEQMLSLARLDPDSSVLKRDQEQIDIRTLLLEVQDMEEINIRNRHQKVELDIPADATFVMGYEDLLLVALRNLIGNASKYSPPQTVIQLGSWRSDDSFGLYVQDQGTGIAQDELPTITQRFKRGKEVTAEGSGLGLAIVERIAEIHQASLLISNLPGGGLRVELRWKQTSI